MGEEGREVGGRGIERRMGKGEEWMGVKNGKMGEGGGKKKGMGRAEGRSTSLRKNFYISCCFHFQEQGGKMTQAMLHLDWRGGDTPKVGFFFIGKIILSSPLHGTVAYKVI